MTNRSGVETTPIWSADGRTIAFSTTEYGVTRIYTAVVDGGRAEVELRDASTSASSSSPVHW